MQLLLTTDTVGGVWTYAVELARAIRPHGVRVALATMGAPLSAAQRAEADAVSDLAVYESDYRLEWMPNPWDDVRRAGDWLLEIEQRVRPDIVHLNGYPHGGLPWRAPVLMVGHSCVHSWWRAVKGEAPPSEYDRYRCEVALGLRAADLVVAPTRSMLNELNRLYGPFRAERVLVNGRDPALFPAGCKEPFILSAGRLWDEAKNISALSSVAERLPWPVYVAGCAEHPGRGHCETPGLQMLGPLDTHQMAKWMGRASIYALPARYEPFGLSALEAAFAGCALVLGDIPSLREVWNDAALFVPPDDPEALEWALCRLISAPEERTALAARSRIRAFRYTPERLAAGYLSAYHYLLKTNGMRNEVRETVQCVS
jgi:glycosyltransferase involved in cell wall biosynthesis